MMSVYSFMYLILLLGANVNAAKFHETALHHAAKVKNLELIELLVEFGGNVFARDNLGKKPSQYTRAGSAPALCLELNECKLKRFVYTFWIWYNDRRGFL